MDNVFVNCVIINKYMHYYFKSSSWIVFWYYFVSSKHDHHDQWVEIPWLRLVLHVMELSRIANLFSARSHSLAVSSAIISLGLRVVFRGNDIVSGTSASTSSWLLDLHDLLAHFLQCHGQLVHLPLYCTNGISDFSLEKGEIFTHGGLSDSHNLNIMLHRLDIGPQWCLIFHHLLDVNLKNLSTFQ